MIFSLILVLGLLTYIILQRTVAPVTATPVWLLWLVMMTPAFLWSAWVLVYGENKPIPPLLMLVPFVLCPTIYLWLVQRGRLPETRSAATDESNVEKTLQTPAEHTVPLRPISQAEETQLRECFPWSVYFLQNLEYRPQAVICWGHLRSNPEEAYGVIGENINKIFGDRFLLVFRENLNGKPFFALVPNPYQESAAENSLELNRPFLAFALFLLSLFTTTVVGAQMAGVSAKSQSLNLGILQLGLPYALALMGIFGVYAVSRFFVARHYRLRSTLPYFIPIPFFLGTLGAFISIRSPVPHRKALFDLSVSGPVLSLLLSLPLLLWGLAHSQVVALGEDVGLFNFDKVNPRFSLLFALLSKLMLGAALTADKAIDLHPVGVAGYVGLVITAFYLMPVGQLDGGHIVHAMFGHRTAAIIGQFSRFLLLILSVVQRELLLWALLLFLIPIRDEPALNDVTELDNKRDLLGLVMLGLLLLIILPLPKFLLNVLQFS
ncbi:site-2 protease family protein [Ancylothrix sp. C2]|uniref:site-2 protease family protein n=1 Tax=Ancylothrix sp. D3o TaxID=2953691 RepID=UPI0021BA61BA|nr:site-2 protease family protein [Ancylothrix sp. D3o]MCT7948537.1 site-2 protease family protein [Ancylothrix sp. D3o]